MLSQEDYVLNPPRDYKINPAKTAFYIEIGGNGGLYSLNIDRILLYNDTYKNTGRFGIMAFPNGYSLEQAYVLENTFSLFKNPHHLELGIGLTLQRRYNEASEKSNLYAWENLWWGLARIGYRYQKQDDGLFLKAGFTPILFRKNNQSASLPYFEAWGGIALGLSF